MFETQLTFFELNIQVVERGFPANTFVMFVKLGLEEAQLLEMCSYIDEMYSSLPFSAVNLDAYVIIVSANTYVKDKADWAEEKDSSIEYCVDDPLVEKNHKKIADRNLTGFFKKNFQRNNDTRGVTVVQVVYDSEENVGRILDDLIWQRGSFLDGQVLTIT